MRVTISAPDAGRASLSMSRRRWACVSTAASRVMVALRNLHVQDAQGALIVQAGWD